MKFESFNLNIIYKSGKEMIIVNTLSQHSNYQLCTMKFDEAVKIYAHNETLTGEEDLNQKLQKYGDQLKLNDDKMIYHQDNVEDIWVSYMKHWAQSDFLNQIHNNYGHVGPDTMFNIIWVRQWWSVMQQEIRHFIQHCSVCQLTAKPWEIAWDVMHSSHT